MKRIYLSTIAIVSLSTDVLARSAYYTDILRPNGHERTMAEKLADGHACGATRNGQYNSRNEAAFRKCMSAHGWQLERVEMDPGDKRDKSPWCYAGTHDCAIDDIDCTNDPAHLLSVEDNCAQ
jgi:hypothetical protein